MTADHPRHLSDADGRYRFIANDSVSIIHDAENPSAWIQSDVAQNRMEIR